MKNLKLALAIMAFGFMGFNANAQSSGISQNSMGNITNQNGDIHIEGMGYNKVFKMNGGTLHIEGADNQITVNGFADRVIIEGANVSVRIDKVNSVKIEGANTKVFYKTSANKSGKPAVSVFGSNSSVVKIK